ncbi:putative reverse transcriptase domain-containing protein, partial [Tanacetum coccineum]
VMAILVISVSSDSSEDSVGTPAGRVILFDTILITIHDTPPVITPPTTQTDTTVIPIEIPIIAPTIPLSPDYTPASPDYSPASDLESDPSEDPSSDHIPPLPAISPFLSSANDTPDSDTPETPPSPTHGTLLTETTLSTQRSPTASGALRRRVMVLAPGQPIPHGRPYHYHLNGPVHLTTVGKRVGPLPTYRLAVRHSVDYSSSDHFSSDDSSSDSSPSSSSKTSSDSSVDALSDSASSRSSSDHSLPASSLGTRSSHRLCSLVPSVHHSSAIFERPYHDSSSASHSRKRSRSHVASVPLSSPTLGALSYARVDLLPSPKRIRKVGLGVDFEDESSEPSRSRGTNLVMDVDVVRSDKIKIDPKIQAEIDECFAYADALRDRGIDARVVVKATDREESETGMRGPVEVRVEKSTVTILTERVAELERDNRRLRGTKMPNTQSGASRTREEVNDQSDRWVAEALRVCDAVRNLGPLMGDEVEQEEVGGNGNGGNGDRGNGNGGNGDGGNGNGGNGNRGNGNGENGNANGNGGEYGYNFRGFMPAIECTYQDFLKCQPLNFNGTEGVVGLTRWFEKMETVFHISNCPEKYQVKYASCTLLNSALTWWNSHKRTIGNEAAYAMSWAELMKMVPNKEDRVERFNRGLPDNIQGNVIIANLVRFQDVIRHPFDIDLMLVELGSFDVIIGMDWLAKYHALIICDKKVVCIPYRDKGLIIQGDDYYNGITSKKAKDKSEDKRLEDVPIKQEFPEVFPDDLPGLPPARQVEFQIDKSLVHL